MFQTKNHRNVIFRRLKTEDFPGLSAYLMNLSPETKHRFGPHSYDLQAITDLYQNSTEYRGYIALDDDTSTIIAYTIIKKGYLEHDCPRLKSYGFIPDHTTDCTIAPSVADAWQSLGIGNQLFHFIISDLRVAGINRIILWGGVQCDNGKAVNFYKKNSFNCLGQFEYYGQNFDMVCELNHENGSL